MCPLLQGDGDSVDKSRTYPHWKRAVANTGYSHLPHNHLKFISHAMYEQSPFVLSKWFDSSINL